MVKKRVTVMTDATWENASVAFCPWHSGLQQVIGQLLTLTTYSDPAGRDVKI
jgi:hypothetical protein